MKAAAKGYFGKSLEHLTLAQDAILAAIPQSPTKFDLIKNAEEVCLDRRTRTRRATRPTTCADCQNIQLVPPDREIVQRRNYVLDLMKTRSPLTGSKHTVGRVRGGQEGAGRPRPAGRPPRGARPTSSGRSATRSARSSALTPPPTAPKVDTGGYQVTTTLDWDDAEDRREVASTPRPARRNAKDPPAILKARKIPQSRWGLDPRPARPEHQQRRRRRRWTTGPGEVLRLRRRRPATRRKGNKKFQPQFDVLSDGWRQPGSAIKPIDYLDRHRRQDADRVARCSWTS